MIERQPARDGGASYRVELSADEAHFVVDVGVDRSVDRAEFLAVLHPRNTRMFRSRRPNDWGDFSTRLLRQRPTSCRIGGRNELGIRAA